MNDVPMTQCRVCEVDVPDGEFCGLCGVHLTRRRGDGPEWLRLREFGAAPGEHVLTPSLASSLFPQLPPRARRTFGVGLLAVIAALVGLALMRLPGTLISVAALGIPLLFVLYLVESDARRDLPTADLVITTVLGIVLGVAWVLLTGAMVARSYGVPLGIGIFAGRHLNTGIGVSLGTALLIFVPAVMVRILGPPRRGEALDGFMIGTLGALAFTAAGTLTRLAPQLTIGMVNHQRPMGGLLVEAAIRGFTVPVTAAAAGGLIGVALWFTRPPNKAGKHTAAVRWILAGFGLGIMFVFVCLALVNTVAVPQLIGLLCHGVVAAMAVVLLRIGLQLALLHEAHDEIQADQPLFCPNCAHVVPDMAFCPACGVATRATSRSSRRARREHRPVRLDDGGQR